MTPAARSAAWHAARDWPQIAPTGQEGDHGGSSVVLPARGYPSWLCSLSAARAAGYGLALLSVVAASAAGPAPERTELQSPWSGILSRPLPGTLARDDADLASALERALAGFDGVNSARVVIARPPAKTSLQEPAPRRAAVQVTLSPEVPCTTSWTETLAAFILQAIPELDPAQLTVVDSAGHALYAGGRARAPQAQPLTGAPDDEPPASATSAWWWLLAVALVGLGVTAALLTGRSRRAQRAPAAEAGPLSFLRDLSSHELRLAFAGERTEVIAAALSALSPPARERLRRVLAVPAHVQALQAALSPQVLTAMAQALREKLEGGERPAATEPSER